MTNCDVYIDCDSNYLSSFKFWGCLSEWKSYYFLIKKRINSYEVQLCVVFATYRICNVFNGIWRWMGESEVSVCSSRVLIITPQHVSQFLYNGLFVVRGISHHRFTFLLQRLKTSDFCVMVCLDLCWAGANFSFLFDSIWRFLLISCKAIFFVALKFSTPCNESNNCTIMPSVEAF